MFDVGVLGFELVASERCEPWSWPFKVSTAFPVEAGEYQNGNVSRHRFTCDGFPISALLVFARDIH